MANNTKTIQNGIKTVSRKQIKQVIINDFQDLQNEAIQLILQADKVATLIDVKNESLAIETQKLYDKMRYNKQVVVKLTKASQRFQSAVTKFQNSTLGLIYMNEKTGKIIVQSDLQMQKFFATYVTKNRGRGNVNITKNRQKILEGLGQGDPIRQKFKQIEQRLNRESKLYYSVLQTAFVRQQRQDMKYKQRQVKFKNSFHYRMSKTKIGWSRSTAGHGYINEAYLRGLIYSLFQGGGLQNNLKILKQQLDETSNKGAAFGQDIQTDIDGLGHIHLAVKTNQFSTGMIRQFIILAFAIMALPAETTSEQFIKWIESNSQINFERIAEKFLEDFYTKDTTLKDFLNQWKGNIHLTT